MFLQDARFLFSQERYDSCVSRAYYSIYRAAIALMEHFGYIRPTWNHGRLLSALRQRMVIERGILEMERVDELEIVYHFRRNADYENDWILPDDARRAITMAENFITTVIEVIGHEIEQ